MPLTPLQERVLAVLAPLRHPGSHVAGSLPLHVSPASERESRDIDLFHDAQMAMQAACEQDCRVLAAAGLPLRRTGIWGDTFRRGVVDGDPGGGAVEIDWAVDAAWRFFPPVEDPVLGWRLHDLDLACNKALAVAGRAETRDLIDILVWHRRFGLPAILWAACGKDPGYTPLGLLEQMRRNARIDPGQLAVLKARQVDPVAVKQAWLTAADAADAAIEAFADTPDGEEPGVAFLDRSGAVRWPAPGRPLDAQALVPHRPSVGGCVPIVGPVP